MCVCHTCDVTSCVNPDHLFLGTVSENNLDKKRKLRHTFKVDETIREVILLLSKTLSNRKIAAKLGLGKSTIQKVIYASKQC